MQHLAVDQVGEPTQKHVATKNLNKTEYKKEKKDKYHTFLMFQSGAIILSSPYLVEMKMVFEKFVKYVLDNKKFIEETLVDPCIEGELPPTLTF